MIRTRSWLLLPKTSRRSLNYSSIGSVRSKLLKERCQLKCSLYYNTTVIVRPHVMFPILGTRDSARRHFGTKLPRSMVREIEQLREIERKQGGQKFTADLKIVR